MRVVEKYRIKCITFYVVQVETGELRTIEGKKALMLFMMENRERLTPVKRF